jgi:putative transposase
MAARRTEGGGRTPLTAFVLKQAEDGTPVAEVCRKAGIAEATFYNWRKRYAGLMPSEVKRLR